MKRILLTAFMFTSIFVSARGRIQDADFKTATELKTAVASITGNLTNGNNCIASPSSLVGLAVGQYLYDLTTAANIPSGTTIAGLPGTCSAGQIQMSANAAGSGTGDSIGVGAPLSQLLNDSKVWVSSVVPAQQLSTAITAGLIGGGGGNSGKNYLANAGFEGGNSSWTISGATNEPSTSDFHDGVQALTLTPTGAGSILQSATPAPNLFGTNLESGMWVKTSKTGVELCALSSGSEVECQAVPAVGQWVYIPANMPGPVQGQTIGVKLKWSSTGGSIIVDQSWTGGATNLTKVQQAKHVGTLKYPIAANCIFEENHSGVYSGYSADTDCATPSVTGALTAPSTKIPAFKMDVVAGSTYRVTVKSSFYNANGTAIVRFRLHDGTTATEPFINVVGHSGLDIGRDAVGSVIYQPTTSGLKTIEIQSDSTSTAEGISVNTGIGDDLVFEVEEFPSHSQLAVNSLQGDTGWRDCNSNAFGTLFTATTTNPTIGGTVVKNKCQWRRRGENAEIKWDYSHTSAGVVGSGIYLFNIPPEIGTIDLTKVSIDTESNPSLFARFGSGVGYGVVTTDGGYIHQGPISPYSSTQLKLNIGYTGGTQGALIFGNTTTCMGATECNISYSINVPIQGWTENQRAPALVGSVTSGAGNALRIEYASVSDTGTVSSESSDWITGNCTNASPRVCTIPSGLFSSPPICFATGTDSSSTPDTYPTIQSVSTTSFSVMTNNHLPGFANVTNQRPFNVTCMGPK